MKRNLLALAVGAAIAMPGVALADAATIYGRMDLSLDRVSIDNDTGGANDDGSNWEVNSHASRFGVKGDADLGSGLKALYKIEWQVDADDGSDTLKARNRYVGLSGGFGTVLLGMMDTPLKSAQGKVDQFNDWSGDIGNVLIGEYRAKNVISYTSPKIADVVTLSIALPQIEENETFGCATKYDGASIDTTDCDDGLFDVISASVVYSQKNVYAALAYDQAMPSSIAAVSSAAGGGVFFDEETTRYDTVRLVGSITAGNMQFGAIYSVSEQNDDYIPSGDKEIEVDGYLLSGALTMNKLVLKAQYGLSAYDLGEDDADVSLLSFGADYVFTKQTKVYANYNMWELDAEDGNDDGELSIDSLSVGMQHKF